MPGVLYGYSIALVVAALAAPSGGVQVRADLSGTWMSATTPRRLVITQDASRLTITEPGPRGDRRLVYQLDGSESRNETTTVTGEGWVHVSRARWVSSALVISTTTTRAMGQSWDWMQIYHRDRDGNLMVTMLDAVLDPGPFNAMSMRTIAYKKE